MERPTGSLGVSPSGNAVYTYPIEVPPGIGTDNQPDLSLSYSQSADSSGICGLRWSLNGLSSIFCTPPIAAIDGKLRNTNIQLEHRYALDGSQLICTSGVYGGSNAAYSTETNATEEIRGSADKGFIIVNDDGRIREYGTSPDSIIRGQKGMPVEWKLKKSSDCFGNYMTYNYTDSPRLRQTKQRSLTSGSRFSYIDSIKYTSNDRAGYQGRLMVDFFYGNRRDVVLSSTYGMTSILAHRLEQIETGVVSSDDSYIQMARAYRLEYNYSPDSGDSLLDSITELSSRYRALTPTKFTYSTNNGQLGYKHTFQDMTHFYNLHDTISVIPVDIRGKNTGDVVTVQRDRATGSSQLVSYFAEIISPTPSKQTIKWTQSSGFRAYASLPRLDPQVEPNILIADLNHDGRTDIIIPYKDANGRLMFSVSRAKIQGFEDAVILPSGQLWHPNSKFFALDTNGNGLIDIVEVVYHASGYCEIQTYFDICQVSSGHLPAFARSKPWYEKGSTVDWVVIRHHISGSTGLVHITNVHSKQGMRELCATTFKSTSLLGDTAAFVRGTTSVLTSFDYSDGVERSVLSCDINGDGTQDIVLCSMRPSQGVFKFNLMSFIHDGQGTFSKQQERTFMIRNDMLDTSKKGQFITVSLDNGRYPSVGYLYPDTVKNSWVLLSGRGDSQGNIAEFQKTTLFSAITAPIDSFTLTQTDLNGNGVSDWFAYRITGSTFSLCPIYSKLENAELLKSVTNPLGLKQTLNYASLNSSVYSPGSDIIGQKYAAADDFSDVICLGGKAQVVASITEVNEPTINAIPHQGKWSYTYEGLKLSRRNLGILGFASVSRLDELAGIRTTTKYSQTWPLIGFPVRVDTYGSSEENLRKRLLDSSRSWAQDNLVLMQSKITTAVFSERSSPNKAPIVVIQIAKEETKTFDSNGTTSSTVGKRWEYRGQTTQKILEVSYAMDDSNGAILTQLFTRISYATPVAGINNLISASKISASARNTNLAVFEDGDISLSKHEYSVEGALSRSDSWSTDLQSFVTTSRTTNKHGLEVESIDATGLTIRTSYDPLHPSYATSIISEGSSVRSVERSAYDPKFGVLVASLSDDGVLTTDSQDDWGRSWLKQVTATGSDGKPFVMNSTVERIVAIDDTFKTLINQTPVHAVEEQKYDMQIFTKKLCGTTTMFYNDATQAKRPEIELVDCLGATCRTLQQDNGQAEVYCIATKHDSSGAVVMNSLPYVLTDLQSIDQIPNENQAVHKIVDALGRDIVTMRPQNNNRKGWVGVVAGFSLAGRQRTAQVYTMDTISSISSWSQQSGSQSSQQFLYINEEDRLISTTNADGKTTRFEYDAMGRLIKLTDPSGKSEIRKYNSMGSIVLIDNSYQNPLKQAQGLISVYDAGGRLVSETNALGQVRTWKYDALGRIIERKGVMSKDTVRTTTWTYDSPDSGQGRLARVDILQGQKPQLSYEYRYDARARVVSMTLSSKDVLDNSWTTQYTYDRQSNVIAKVMPDNSRTENIYAGSLLVRSNMISPEGQNWSLSVQNESFSGFSVPNSSLVQGQGDVNCQFRSLTAFDVNGSIEKLLLQGGEGLRTLAGLGFVYNDMDQISQMTNLITSQSTSYGYKAGRLVSSKSKDFDRSYTYNDSGDLLTKDGMSISVSPSGKSTETTGSKNGQRMISTKSDAAGRLIERQLGDGPVVIFEYDENGKMSKASSSNGVKRFITNHNLATVLQINSNGDVEIKVDPNYSEVLSSGGARTIMRSVRTTEHAIGSMNTTFETSTSTPKHSLEIYMRDHKGSITHVFNADGTLNQEYQYDDFGARTITAGSDKDKKSGASYEDMDEDEFSGLIDFQARMYDPILGKFTTPDTMLELSQAVLTDGLNRMVFENNDPINHIDPTGHMTWEAGLGIGLGIALLIGGLVLGVMTAGAATPLAALGFAM